MATTNNTIKVYNTPLMQAYRAARAKGDSIAYARGVARGDYERNEIALDWDGYNKAEARTDDYEIEVRVEPDYDASIEDHLCGDFEDEEKYRLLPWGGKRNFRRRYVLASTLTQKEIDYRTRDCTRQCRGKKCNHEHEPSTRYDRDWSVWYIDYGIAGGAPKGRKQNQRDADVANAKIKHDMMDYYWRHGYSKSDAYVKAMKAQREAAKYASSGLEFYMLNVTITRADDGREVADEYRGGFDVDGSEPTFKAFAPIKEEAAVFVGDVLHELALKEMQRNGVEQTTLF